MRKRKCIKCGSTNIRVLMWPIPFAAVCGSCGAGQG